MHTPIGYELPADDLARPFSWWSFLAAAFAGACGAAIGAVAVGVSYIEANIGQEIPWAMLAPPFVVYMIATGALAGLVVRAGVLISVRHPVLGAASFGALAGLAPGAIAAREFGSQPLPFVGSAGMVLGALPLFLTVAVETARGDGKRMLRPAGIAVLLLTALFAALAFCSSFVSGLTMLELLRAFLFMGLERLGAALGAAIGLLLGLVCGLTVAIDRALRR